MISDIQAAWENAERSREKHWVWLHKIDENYGFFLYQMEDYKMNKNRQTGNVKAEETHLNDVLMVGLDYNTPDHPMLTIARRIPGDGVEIIGALTDDAAMLMYWALTGEKKVQIQVVNEEESDVK